MVRALSLSPIVRQSPPACGARGLEGLARARFLILGVLAVNAGCAIVPRERMDECQRVSKTLRSENARLKDQVLALQTENRDYADRAVDDSRRLAIQDEAIERLEHSVQAYQQERTRLESAYKQLASSLGAAGSPPVERVGRKASDTRTRDESRSPSQPGRRESPDRVGDSEPRR